MLKPHQHGCRGVQARRGSSLRQAEQRGCPRHGHGLLEVSRARPSVRADAHPGAAPIPACVARGRNAGTRAERAARFCNADAPICDPAPCCREIPRLTRRSRPMRCATPSRSIRKTLRCSRAWPSASSPRPQRARVPWRRYDRRLYSHRACDLKLCCQFRSLLGRHISAISIQRKGHAGANTLAKASWSGVAAKEEGVCPHVRRRIDAAALFVSSAQPICDAQCALSSCNASLARPPLNLPVCASEREGRRSGRRLAVVAPVARAL